MEVSEIRQFFCGTGWNWTIFLQEGTGLAKLYTGASGMSQTFERVSGISEYFGGCGWDWSIFVWEGTGLVKLCVRASWISQSFEQV